MWKDLENSNINLVIIRKKFIKKHALNVEAI